MEEKKIQCPNCGGPNSVSDIYKEHVCVFCSSSFIPKEVEEKTSKVRPENDKTYNWMIMAETAKEGGNYDEAINYYNKILEEDSSHSASWFGKGSAIIWSSTIGNIRMSEAITYFKNAIQFSKSNNMKSSVAIELASTAIPFYETIKKHYKEYSELDNSSIEFIERYKIIESGLSFGLECDSNIEALIDTGLFIVKDIDSTLYYLFREFTNHDQIYNKYVAAKKKIKPDWEPGPDPKISAERERSESLSKSGNCFIATATMGDYNHPTVIQLRSFRDNYLLQRNWGINFIKLYYKFGPYPARLIAKHDILKKISYDVIIRPLSFITSKLLKRAK